MWFGCKFDGEDFDDNHSALDIYKRFQDDITRQLTSYLAVDGTLSGNKMMADYFPTVNADIFICHSHNDEEKSQNLAGWLFELFGLRFFVDSMVWGSADRLLQKIDDEYCDNPGENTYNYRKRNLSTSYVHMMLAASLANMMDKCHCFIFMESEQSITPSTIKRANAKETFSPWIFYELALFHKIQKRRLKKTILEKRTSTTDSICLENFSISLSAETKDLYPLSVNTLKKLHKAQLRGNEALIKLHEILSSSK